MLEPLTNRTGFRKDVGLSIADRTPDEPTFARFRERPRAAGLHVVIVDAMARQIEGQGLLVRQRLLVDATIIEVLRGRRPRDETTTRDQDASPPPKHTVPHQGPKGRIAVSCRGS